MHCSWLELSAYLYAWHKLNSGLAGGSTPFRKTINCVVIGDCYGGGASRGGKHHKLSGRRAAIRAVGVRMQIDQSLRHTSILSRGTDSSQFSAAADRESRRSRLTYSGDVD